MRTGQLVLWHDFRRWNQTFQDLSGQGNHGTPSNVWWGGGGVQFADANGNIVIPDAASIRLTALSILVVGPFDNLERAAASESFLMTKDDNGMGTIEWQFAIDNTPQLLFIDTANTRTLGVAWSGARTLGVTATNGGTPTGYVNGLSGGAFSGTVTLGGGPAGFLNIGNRFAANRSQLNPGWAYLLWNRVLTASEMATAHGELLSLPGGEH